jgi:hypothetical protein
MKLLRVKNVLNKLIKKYEPVTESMEGAALALCLQEYQYDVFTECAPSAIISVKEIRVNG